MLNIKSLLDDDGVFIFESPHIKNLIQKNEYDTIYHEHLSYLSLKPLIKFAKKFNMKIFDVYESDIHGGILEFSFAKTTLMILPRISKICYWKRRELAFLISNI